MSQANQFICVPLFSFSSMMTTTQIFSWIRCMPMPSTHIHTTQRERVSLLRAALCQLDCGGTTQGCGLEHTFLLLREIAVCI